jgi:hypothetical protein
MRVPVPGPPQIDHVTGERRTARRVRAGRWLLVGLGLLLVALGQSMMFSPVDTEDSEQERSCGDRPAIVAAFGASTAASRDADWCRDEAVNQAFGGLVLLTLPGALILAWQGRRAWRARRAPQDRHPDVTGNAHTSDGFEPAQPSRRLPGRAPQDRHPDSTGNAHTSVGSESAHPSRRLPGRLVATGNTVWLVVESQPDQSTPLMVSRRQTPKLPFAAREFEVAGDTSRRITFWSPGTDKTFTARPDLNDRLRRWWAARSKRGDSVELTGEVHGPPSHPSIAAASPPQPDPLQVAWAHPPARKRLQRSLRGAGLMLATALLLATVFVWETVNPQDWFWEPSETGEAKGVAFADMFFLGSVFLLVIGAVGIARFFRRRSILRRQPWRLGDIMTPDFGQVVLREHAGTLGPLKYEVATSGAEQEKDRVRVLACKQLWFVPGHGGTLVAATPDFRTMVRLRPERTTRRLRGRAHAAGHLAPTDTDDGRTPSAQVPGDGAAAGTRGPCS